MSKSDLPPGLVRSVPVALAATSLGVTYGILAAPLLGPWMAVLMSAIVWTGGAQFAAVGVLGAGGSLFLAACAAVVTNGRYLPMGFAIAPSLSGPWWRRASVGMTLTDASFAIGRVGDTGRFDIGALVWSAPLQYVGWLGGTTVGVFAAGHIGSPEALGLDVIFPVFFLGLLLPALGRVDVPRWRVLQKVRWDIFAVSLAAGAVTLVLTPFLPAGVPLLCGTMVALVGLLPWRSSKEDPLLNEADESGSSDGFDGQKGAPS